MKLLKSMLTSCSRLPYSNQDSNLRMCLLSVSLSRDLSKLVLASSVTRRLRRSKLKSTMTRKKTRKSPRVTLKPKLLAPKSQRVMKSPPRKMMRQHPLIARRLENLQQTHRPTVAKTKTIRRRRRKTCD